MEFISKAHSFFMQLKYCLTIMPETIVMTETGWVSALLEPNELFKLIREYDLEYPFNSDHKIIELKSIMNKEGLSPEDAIKIIEDLKDYYWCLDTVIMFPAVEDKIIESYKIIQPHISDQEILKETTRYQMCLRNDRKNIYEKLVYEIKGNSESKRKEKPNFREKSIIFSDSQKIGEIYNELKCYFSDEQQSELLKVLEGENPTRRLLFLRNGNSFVEVFKRLKYNGFVLNTYTEIHDWICDNFCFLKTNGNNKIPTDFNINTVWDTLTKAKNEVSKRNRICTPDWLPYKSNGERQRETKD